AAAAEGRGKEGKATAKKGEEEEDRPRKAAEGGAEGGGRGAAATGKQGAQGTREALRGRTRHRRYPRRGGQARRGARLEEREEQLQAVRADRQGADRQRRPGNLWAGRRRAGRRPNARRRNPPRQGRRRHRRDGRRRRGPWSRRRHGDSSLGAQRLRPGQHRSRGGCQGGQRPLAGSARLLRARAAARAGAGREGRSRVDHLACGQGNHSEDKELHSEEQCGGSVHPAESKVVAVPTRKGRDCNRQLSLPLQFGWLLTPERKNERSRAKTPGRTPVGLSSCRPRADPGARKPGNDSSGARTPVSNEPRVGVWGGRPPSRRFL